eukprot:347475-Chlamydomonas_euryale.AAC.3
MSAMQPMRTFLPRLAWLSSVANELYSICARTSLQGITPIFLTQTRAAIQQTHVSHVSAYDARAWKVSGLADNAIGMLRICSPPGQ